MMSFVEKERLCEKVFEDNGPFWHVYTDGSRMVDLFSSETEMKEGMTALAVCSVLYRAAQLVTFELMNNHVHLIMCGAQDDCLRLFDMFKRRLKRVFQRNGKAVDWEQPPQATRLLQHLS